ncbi:MAG TPA: helix-turn-helix domain-containing protein [Kofleriaceae bacterium]
MNNQEVFTITELMTRWHASRGTIIKLIEGKKLHGFKLGSKAWRVPRVEVERYENQQQAA